jgi:hypothetical protein
MIWRDLMAFSIGLIVHELGHWILFRYYGYKAKIKIHWWAIEVGREVCHKPTLKQAINIYGSPVIWGMIPVLFFGGYEIFWIYMFISSADIMQIFTFLNYIKNKKIKNVGQMWIVMLKEQIRLNTQKA